MRWRLSVLEAIILLVMARLLVSAAMLRRWRGTLGRPVGQANRATATQADRTLARSIERAAQRLPGTSKCLPRAVALHWMLRRRGRPSQLVIAALPEQDRGTIDDLHAWTEIGDEILIGALAAPFRPVVRFG
ncbi:MAG TPA: lasso peptide biosynthesis B2 protein [Novosphingobium sp.]|jgi:hypothetical protein|nr:lasso peptide biosynthesis B2 protein [Novosphingobium sp.]HNN56077.1 lasso peptide biosynthesis B2 protein [Novosphingobium sp.]